jgi:signal transduction histidine kinase
MTALVLALIVPFVLGLFVACANLVVWRLRPSERAHLALALAGGAAVILLGATGMVYGADSRLEAVAARTALFLGAVPIQLCNVWLSERVYGVKQRVHYATMAGVSLLWACVGLVPGALYGDETVLRGTGLLGVGYLDVELTPLGRVAPLTLLPGIAWFVWRTDRLASGDPDRPVVLATMSASGALAGFDLLTAGAWIDAPYLYGTACTGAAIVYTSLLLRRFVETLARVEASAELLQRAAEARARELRESDLQLAQGARLAALGTLAAGLAHEINNPVAFIRSNLNFLAEMTERGEPDAEFEEVLGETEQGVARLRGIVDELLRMSAQGGTGFCELQLSNVVESALPTLRFEARDDVVLEARLAPVLPVRGDRNLLGQVVANLVLNAIQAIRSTGTPGIVRIATFADGPWAALEVSDSGPGVAPEIAQRIFEPFFTTKPPGQGTGLGLAVCRQLVERHGGRLSLADSARGARFRVDLRLALAEAGRDVAPAASPASPPLA